MGHAPDWCRQNYKKMADGGLVGDDQDGGMSESTRGNVKHEFSATGGGSGQDTKNFGMGGRLSYRRESLDDDSSVEVGVSGHAARWKTQNSTGSNTGVDGVDVSYRKGDTTVSVGRTLNNTNPDMGSVKPGNKGWTFNITKEFADGGKVKKAKR